MLQQFIFIKRSFLWGLVVSFGLFYGSSQAQSVFERLVSPGELSQAHQKIEKTCNECHVSFDKAAQDNLCLACHDTIDKDITQHLGFHGKFPQVTQTICKTCHTEHKGRAFKIVSFDPNSFDHKYTDFILKGAHQKVQCTDCHVPAQLYRDAPSDCYSCHVSDEPHKGNLGKQCQSCHNELDWQEVRFDHSATNFSLTGRHRSVACAQCHIDERYQGIATDCVGCHAEDDIHKTRFGTACAECHVTDGWAKISFNHQQNTGFALTGAHGKIDCQACHTTSLTVPALRRDCISCHRRDDTHKGRNGPDCAQCHSTSAWTTTDFNHDRATRFALRGAHREVACEGCHLQSVTESLPGMECIDCHRNDDPHEGSQGLDCASCHNELSWVENTQFDHDFTRFPLLGKHQAAQCTDCHSSKNFKLASIVCLDCHLEQDIHAGTLGTDCGLCHNPNDWKLWLFDHDIQTQFPLEGAHRGLSCSLCHLSGQPQLNTETTCYSCHKADDQHRGRYGKDCARCHITSNFREIKFPQ